MCLDCKLSRATQPSHFLRALDHSHHVHIEGDVHQLVSRKQIFKFLMKTAGKIVSFCAYREASSFTLNEYLSRCFKKIGIEMHIKVSEELCHRIGADIFDPGRVD